MMLSVSSLESINAVCCVKYKGCKANVTDPKCFSCIPTSAADIAPINSNGIKHFYVMVYAHVSFNFY